MPQSTSDPRYAFLFCGPTSKTLVRSFYSTVDYKEIVMLNMTIPANDDTLCLQCNKIASGGTYHMI
jgi:hypothetical protein